MEPNDTDEFPQPHAPAAQVITPEAPEPVAHNVAAPEPVAQSVAAPESVAHNVAAPEPVAHNVAAPDAVDAAAQHRIRAFIAVNLPLPLIRKLTDEVAAMKGPIAAGGAKVAWVPAANLHLTLKFLGAIRPEVVEAIGEALGRGLAGRPSIEIEVTGMGAFPSAAHPRILWAGIRDQPAFAALQKDIEGWMEALGFPREERPFHAHLTVGRVTHPGAAESIAAQLAPRQTLLFGAARVTDVVLYESRTLAKGAEYRPLTRAMLGRRGDR